MLAESSGGEIKTVEQLALSKDDRAKCLALLCSTSPDFEGLIRTEAVDTMFGVHASLVLQIRDRIRRQDEAGILLDTLRQQLPAHEHETFMSVKTFIQVAEECRALKPRT